MNLRYWIHPGWFRLIDWWRAERARVAEAEEEWYVETTDLWTQRKPQPILNTRIADIPDRIRHPERWVGEEYVGRHSFGFTQLHRTAQRESGLLDLDRVDVPIGAVTDKIHAGTVLRTRRTGECVRVEEIERHEYDLDGRCVERLRVTRGIGAVPLDYRRLTWFELEPVHYVPGIGAVGPIRPTDAL